ncbi:hypothetical protein ETAA8_23650 [Anatilimnocola aggregata]|uniref:DUF1559 domain-containing protein n=1 Tax=Anatilimnocola aggregata TaxID=2528021 RepID=A0A517YAM1_9BACT|nr:DUF1559 domain-containing protein [Anatilimnocola aggregata]QDU27278.1 hypothetical protein ETAA8_23650 [Anatilimnocola aggregata]
MRTLFFAGGPRRFKAGGFTLVELLVVIAIIGVLVALLLPAVQAAREASRRTQCANHLKQMGIATHNFHDTYHYLPGSRIWDHWATWAVQLMPFMEQQSLYEKWNIQEQYYNQPQVIRETNIKLLFCPTRRPPGKPSSSGDNPDNGMPNSTHNPGALSDYAGCSGDFGYSGWFDGINANGAIFTGEVLEQSGTTIKRWKGRVNFAKIEDGTSQTFLIGEKHIVLGKFTIGTGDGSIYNGDHEWGFARVTGPGYPLAPNPKYTTSSSLIFGSYHPAGCQFVLVDGSVRNIKLETSTTVLGRLAVRNDGEVIPDF